MRRPLVSFPTLILTLLCLSAVTLQGQDPASLKGLNEAQSTVLADNQQDIEDHSETAPKPTARGEAAIDRNRANSGSSSASFLDHLTKVATPVALKIFGPEGKVIHKLESRTRKGRRSITRDLRRQSEPRHGPRVATGTDRARVMIGGEVPASMIKIRLDPNHADPMGVAAEEPKDELMPSENDDDDRHDLSDI